VGLIAGGLALGLLLGAFALRRGALIAPDSRSSVFS
jgi:hypothetical protein